MRSKRAILGVVIAIAAAAAACNLFIDADSLVGGAGGDDGGPGGDGSGDENAVPPPTPPGVPPGQDGGDDGPVLPSRPPPDGSVPSCVPPPPTGVSLVALTWGPRGAPPACPTGYAPTAALTAWADFDAGPATCNATGCTCAGPSGTATCDFRLIWADDSACNAPRGTVDSVGSACLHVLPQGAPFGALKGVVNASGVTCPASGTPTFDKPPARFGTEVEGCAPIADAGACGDAGALAMPPASEAFACYVTTTGACANGYSLAMTFDGTDTVDDTRACACKCNQATNPNGCTGGTANVYGTNGCAGGPSATGLGPGCRSAATYGNGIEQATQPTPVANAVTCAPATTQSGTAVATGAAVKLCCVTRCDACKVAAIQADGGCASAEDSCAADPDCAAYRACVDRQCAGVPCAACVQPDAGSLTLFGAIGTCVTTQCAAACK